MILKAIFSALIAMGSTAAIAFPIAILWARGIEKHKDGDSDGDDWP